MAFGIALGLCLIGSGAHDAWAATRRKGKTGAKARPPLKERIDQKLQEARSNQELILQKFDAVMQELQAVKARVSR